MDGARLSRVLIGVGAIVIVAAVVWWYSFFSELMGQSGMPVSVWDASHCIYSMGGECGFVSGMAESVGMTPYRAIVFWVGVIALVIGFVLRATSNRPANRA